MQPGQSYQTLVVHAVVQVALRFLDEEVDLLQPFQIPHGRREEQAENHVHMIGESLASLLLERNEVDHHVRLVEADGDGYVALMNDTERHSCIRGTRAYLFYVWDTQDDQCPSVVVFIAGPLIGIADIRKEIVGYFETLFQLLLVFFRWTRHLYPAARFPLGNLL